jgi:hypothetical protein
MSARQESHRMLTKLIQEKLSPQELMEYFHRFIPVLFDVNINQGFINGGIAKKQSELIQLLEIFQYTKEKFPYMLSIDIAEDGSITNLGLYDNPVYYWPFEVSVGETRPNIDERFPYTSDKTGGMYKVRYINPIINPSGSNDNFFLIDQKVFFNKLNKIIQPNACSPTSVENRRIIITGSDEQVLVVGLANPNYFKSEKVKPVFARSKG